MKCGRACRHPRGLYRILYDSRHNGALLPIPCEHLLRSQYTVHHVLLACLCGTRDAYPRHNVPHRRRLPCAYYVTGLGQYWIENASQHREALTPTSELEVYSTVRELVHEKNTLGHTVRLEEDEM